MSGLTDFISGVIDDMAAHIRQEKEMPGNPYFGVTVNGLTVYAKDDGTWLEFVASDGKRGAMRVENLADGRPGIVGAALRQWCKDRQGEREQTHVHRSIDGQSDECAFCGHDIRHDVHSRITDQ